MVSNPTTSIIAQGPSDFSQIIQLFVDVLCCHHIAVLFLCQENGHIPMDLAKVTTRS